MYMAEIPVLPGCQAWADTHDETLSILESVAEEFIASYKEHGENSLSVR
jgi:predicted RNase H-like HicB family nuclease